MAEPPSFLTPTPTSHILDEEKRRAEETMGEARRRGTFEQRKNEAQSAVLGAIASGRAKHYCIVLDRSQKAVEVIDEIQRGPEELQDRMASAAVQFWMKAEHFTYVAIWGTMGYTGGLTIPTLDLKTLLEEALPAVIERTIEKGGLCATIIGTDPSVQEAIIARIAQLQPTEGSAC